MKKNITFFIIMRNNSEECLRCIDDIRELVLEYEYNISVVVLDAASTGKHAEIISQFNDITLISFEEDEATYANIINMAVETLKIHNDFFILDSCLSITKQVFEDVLYIENEEEKIGSIALYYDTFRYQYAFGQEKWINVLGSSYAAVFIPFSSWNAAKGFNVEINSASIALLDFQLSLNQYGYNNFLNPRVALKKTGENFSFLDDRVPYGNDFELMKSKWGIHYYNVIPNMDLLDMIPTTINREQEISVLEVGCDCGENILGIKMRYPNAQIYGLEINEYAAKVASAFANVQVGNIETDELIWDEKFDVIIFGDVLEHLHDPLKVLRKCREYLKKNAYIISCIPNVQHISVIYPLLCGQFTYTETGLLDKTHIHLFTGMEILKMFRIAGYEIDAPVGKMIPVTEEQEFAINKITSAFPMANEQMFRVWQYLICAKKL